jgi:hypothetical protein
MSESRNTRPGDSGRPTAISDEMLTKVGRAVGQIVEIKQHYRQDLASLRTAEEKNDLTQRAEVAVTHAVREQGLSVEQYNAVMAAAEDDPVLQAWPMAATRGA